MPGLMSGDWKRGTVSGPQRLQRSAWTAPDLFGHRASPRLYSHCHLSFTDSLGGLLFGFRRLPNRSFGGLRLKTDGSDVGGHEILNAGGQKADRWRP